MSGFSLAFLGANMATRIISSAEHTALSEDVSRCECRACRPRQTVGFESREWVRSKYEVHA